MSNGTFFKWAIKDKLLNALYVVPTKHLLKQQALIVKEAAQLDPNFIYHSESYLYYHSKRYYSKDLSSADLIFDPSLNYNQAELTEFSRVKLIKIVEELESLKEEERIIDSYLNTVLNYCNTVADVMQLLPKSTGRFINIKPAYITNTTLTATEIEKYRKLTYKYAQMLNERIIINLITED